MSRFQHLGHSTFRIRFQVSNLISMHWKGPVCLKMPDSLSQTIGCFCNQSGNENKKQNYLTEYAFIDWKGVAQTEQYKGSNSWKEVIAQKEKSILMVMWNPWSHRVSTRLHPICPQTLRAFCLPNKTLPIDPYRVLSMSYPKYKRSCQTQLFVSIPLLPGPPFRVFSPSGCPFLPKPPLWGFRLAGCTFLYVYP